MFPDRHTLIVATASAALAGAAAAQHAGDVLLTLSEGRIATGRVLQGGGFDADVRVFPVRLGVLFPNHAEDPGFDCSPGTFGHPGAIIFSVRGPLLKWSGSAFLSPSPLGERLSIEFGPLGPVLSPIGGGEIDGFSLPVGSNGTWHRHLEFTLLPPASPGLYLLPMSLRSTELSAPPSGSASAVFYLVFNQGETDAEAATASHWVLENLVNPASACPADFNGVDGVTVQDIYDFLTAWSAGDADFNGVGGTTVQDIYDFLTAWSQGCP